MDGECVEPIARLPELSSKLEPVPAPSRSSPLTFRILIGNGFTLVDLNAASGYADNDLDDWYQGNHGVAFQGFLGRGTILFGAEAGYEHLYSWWASPRYGSSDLYYEKQWWTFFAGPVGLLKFGPAYLIAGADFHFMDVPVFGLSGGIGIRIPLGERLSIPLEFRAKPIFGDGSPTVLQLNVGVMFSAAAH